MNYTVVGGQQLFEARDERLGLVKEHICNAETAAAELGWGFLLEKQYICSEGAGYCIVLKYLYKP